MRRAANVASGAALVFRMGDEKMNRARAGLVRARPFKRQTESGAAWHFRCVGARVFVRTGHVGARV